MALNGEPFPPSEEEQSSEYFENGDKTEQPGPEPVEDLLTEREGTGLVGLVQGDTSKAASSQERKLVAVLYASNRRPVDIEDMSVCNDRTLRRQCSFPTPYFQVSALERTIEQKIIHACIGQVTLKIIHSYYLALF